MQSIGQNKCCEDKHDDLLLREERGKKHCVLIKDLNTFMYTFIHYIVEENIFVAIVCKLLEHLTALKLMVNKRLRC